MLMRVILWLPSLPSVLAAVDAWSLRCARNSGFPKPVFSYMNQRVRFLNIVKSSSSTPACLHLTCIMLRCQVVSQICSYSKSFRMAYVVTEVLYVKRRMSSGSTFQIILRLLKTSFLSRPCQERLNAAEFYRMFRLPLWIVAYSIGMFRSAVSCFSASSNTAPTVFHRWSNISLTKEKP